MIAARVYTASDPDAEHQLRQGEIFSGMVHAHLSVDSLGASEAILEQVVHPVSLILTQDCDLEQDFNARRGQNLPDKLIPNVLFCEIVSAEQLRGITGITSDIWKRIRNNKDERYHFLQAIRSEDDAIGQGFPELGLDFKRYFTVPTAEVYKRTSIAEIQRRCRLVSPYLEHLSARFASFLSRVALPQDHASI